MSTDKRSGRNSKPRDELKSVSESTSEMADPRIGFGYKIEDARAKLRDSSLPPRAHPLLIGFSVFLLVFTVAVVSENFIHDIALHAFQDNIRSNLKRLARAGASMVDGDLHRTFRSRDQEKSEAYLRAVEPLKRFQGSDNEIAYVYTCVLEKGLVRFVLDPTKEGDGDNDGMDDKSHINQEYPEASAELRSALMEGMAGADIEPYSDRWGKFISGYAPFRDKDGKVVGIVGVDLAAESYENRLASLKDAYEYSFIVALMLAMLSGLAAGTMQYRSFRLHQESEKREARYREQISLTLERLEGALKIAEVSRNRFSDLFEGIPVSCLTFDGEGHVFEWNTHALLTFSLKAHEVMERRLTEVLGDELLGEEQRALIGGVLEGKTFTNSTWFDGKRTFLISGHPLVGPDGEVSGGILAVVDITRQKQAEDQAQQKVEELNLAHKELNEAHIQLQQVNARLEEMATTDMLTGLPNRRAFYEAIEIAISEARRGESLTLVQADIDFFKRFNDHYGHQAGDEVLCLFAKTLRMALRPQDLVARHGGEEFMIILKGEPLDQALLIIERAREAVAKIDCAYGTITASFGLAEWSPYVGSQEALMLMTDDALYEAKHQGRNRIVPWTPKTEKAA